MRSHRRSPEQWAAIAARIQQEGPISVCHAARLVPTAKGSKASPSTLVRWIIHGKKGVFLDGARLTSKNWWTSRAALERFWGELSDSEAWRRQDAAEAPTITQWEERARAADRELIELVGE